MKASVYIVVLLCITSYAFRQKDTTQVSARSKLKNAFNQFRDSPTTQWLNQDTIASQARQLSNERFKTELVSEKEKQKEIEEDVYAIEHRERSFDFQYHASIGIFVMVILIVVTGLFFSGWQFSLAIRQLNLKESLIKTAPVATAVANAATPAAEGAPPVENNPVINALKSEVELSPTSIKANSSVLGVIILVLSIAFFYLYLIYVYPIKYLSPGSIGNKSDTAISAKEK